MTAKNKERLNLALLNAAELIRSQTEVGINPEDVNEKDEKGLEEYGKSCERASKMIETLARKYNKK